jgi:transposase
VNGDRTLLFADEAGLYLLPMAGTTWSPVGETPILVETASRDHLSLMAAVTPDGKLYTLTLDRAFKGGDVVIFLKRLLRQIPGQLTVVWDGASIHRSKEVKTFLSEGAAKRLHLERLPAYAPELNPAEGIWSYLKRVELANVCCHDLSELREELHRARERLRHKVDVLKACVLTPGCY